MMNHNETDADVSSSNHLLMTEEEARIWRRRFISACRFDSSSSSSLRSRNLVTHSLLLLFSLH
jgi:hypothetical protein